MKIDLGAFYSRYYGRGNVISTLNQLVVNDMRREFPDVAISDGGSKQAVDANLHKLLGRHSAFADHNRGLRIKERGGQSK